jgi:uncharacterized membrane protein
MEKNQKYHIFPLTWLKFICIIIIVIGISFRFVNLDHKVYSADEVRAILRLTGYTSQQFIEEVYTGDIVPVAQIEKYQRLTPSRDLTDAINAFSGNAEHPPLYGLITRFWMKLFNVPVSARLASVSFGILAFPCLYWLCLELFESSLTGWIAVAIVAVSPFHIHASQNATQYSLWIMVTLLTNAAFLQAIRLNKKIYWLIYLFTLVIGFYTHFFFVFVVLGHLLYLIIIEKFRITSKILYYILSLTGGIMLFAPWIFWVVNDLDKIKINTRYYSSFNPTFQKVINSLLKNIGNVFIDFHNTTKIEQHLDIILFVIILYSFYFICRRSPIKVWLFVLILVFLTPCFHIIPNFFSPSARPLQARYYVPCFVGIQLSVSYLIASNFPVIISRFQRRFGGAIFLYLLVIGVVSGIFITQIRDWGLDDQKGTASGVNLSIATIINEARQPLVISDTTHSFVLALSRLLDEKVKFQLFKPQDQKQWENKLNIDKVFSHYSDVFIYFPRNQDFLGFIDLNKNFHRELIENSSSRQKKILPLQRIKPHR